MTVMNKSQKQYDQIVVFLFLALIIVYANIAYAGNLVVNNKIVFSTIQRQKVMISDMQNGKFGVDFVMPKKTSSGRFIIYGKEKKQEYIGTNVEGTQEISIATHVRDNEKHGYITGKFPKQEAGDYRSFNIQLLGQDGSTVIDAIVGRMPELNIRLKDSKADGVYDTLVFKNICPAKIKITEIKSDGKFNLKREEIIDFAEAGKSGDTQEIKLDLDAKFCSEDNKSFDEVIKFKYTVDDVRLDDQNVVGNIKISSDCSSYVSAEKKSGWGGTIAGLLTTAAAGGIGFWKYLGGNNNQNAPNDQNSEVHFDFDPPGFGPAGDNERNRHNFAFLPGGGCGQQVVVPVVAGVHSGSIINAGMSIRELFYAYGFQYNEEQEVIVNLEESEFNGEEIIIPLASAMASINIMFRMSLREVLLKEYAILYNEEDGSLKNIYSSEPYESISEIINLKRI